MNILEDKLNIERAIKYRILIRFLMEIVNTDTTYDIIDKISQMLRCLGELEDGSNR